jgi:hypothetical protein
MSFCKHLISRIGNVYAESHIFADRHVSTHKIPDQVRIFNGSVGIIIYNNLWFKNMSQMDDTTPEHRSKERLKNCVQNICNTIQKRKVTLMKG